MYNEIKLEKTLYNISGKSFTQALSEQSLRGLTLMKDSSRDLTSK